MIKISSLLRLMTSSAGPWALTHPSAAADVWFPSPYVGGAGIK